MILRVKGNADCVSTSAEPREGRSFRSVYAINYLRGDCGKARVRTPLRCSAPCPATTPVTMPEPDGTESIPCHSARPNPEFWPSPHAPLPPSACTTVSVFYFI